MTPDNQIKELIDQLNPKRSKCTWCGEWFTHYQIFSISKYVYKQMCHKCNPREKNHQLKCDEC